MDRLRPPIDPAHPERRVRRRCELLGLDRPAVGRRPAAETPENLRLMGLIGRPFTARPFYGRRRMTAWLKSQGREADRERARRRLGVLGLEAIHPRPGRRGGGRPHRGFPHLLRDVAIGRPDQARSADITYLPVRGGFTHLAAAIDWFSRCVVAWRLSNTLDGQFCRDTPDEALTGRAPEVLDTDQGVQLTARAWTDRRGGGAGIRVSMDGRGRAADNVLVERLWRSAGYEDVYLGCHESAPELERGPRAYFAFHNHERLHRSLGCRTPAEVYGGSGNRAGEE